MSDEKGDPLVFDADCSGCGAPCDKRYGLCQWCADQQDDSDPEGGE